MDLSTLLLRAADVPICTTESQESKCTIARDLTEAHVSPTAYKLPELSDTDFVTFQPRLDFSVGVGTRAMKACKRRRVALPDLSRYQARLNIWPARPIARSSPLHLLGLPTEIRQRIYDFLIIEEDDSESLSRVFWRMKYQAKWPLWHLIWSCRQLRDEGFYYYFGTTRFTASITDLQNKTYAPWIHQIGDAGCAALRRFDFASVIKVSRYAVASAPATSLVTSADAAAERKVAETYRICYLLRVQLLAEAPYCHIEPVNVDIEHNVRGAATDSDTTDICSEAKRRARQEFLRATVLACNVELRRAELQAVLAGMYAQTPLGMLRQPEVLALMQLAAIRRYHKTTMQ